MSLPAGSIRGVPARDASLHDLSTKRLLVELTHRVKEWKKSANGRDRRQAADQHVTRLLGQLHRGLEPFARHNSNRYSVEKSLRSLRVLSRHPDFSHSDLRDRVFLEVGCGGLSPLASLTVMAAAGVRQAIGIDLDQLEDPEAATRAVYDSVSVLLTGVAQPPLPGDWSGLLENLRTFDLAQIYRGNPNGIDRERVQFRTTALEDAGLESESIDFVVSCSFFEHVADPVPIIRELARVMRPGALAAHLIDGSDHKRYIRADVDPLDMLCDPSDGPLVRGMNRIRPHEFRALFESEGFEIRDQTINGRVDLTEERIQQFTPRFRAMPVERLEEYSAGFWLRRM